MRMRLPWLVPASAIAFALTSSKVASADDRPQLAWDEPVHCMTDPKGRAVRVQCHQEGAAKVCLVAPNETTDGAPLTRIKDCEQKGVEEYNDLLRSGAHMIGALAETPPGYARSEHGRAYQVKFALLDRVYIGMAWTPTFFRKDARLPISAAPVFSRARIESGFSASVLNPNARARHEVHLLEGSAAIDDLEVEGQLFAYDYQHMHRRPTLFVSTFVGPPHLYEIALPIGWGFRVLGVHDRPPAFRSTLDAEVGEVHLAWSPWQSEDLYSHIRLEAGGDGGLYWDDRSAIAHGIGTGNWYAGFSSAARCRFALGDGGLHTANIDLTYQHARILEGAYAGEPYARLRADLAYEGVLLAVNDQPISIRLGGGGDILDEPATHLRSVAFHATAGLRFSFWAPARVPEKMPVLEDP